MSNRAMFSLIVLLVVIITGSQSMYIITETQRAVLLHLGKVVNPDVSTGLHFKWPGVDEVRIFDARILTLDAPAERFLTVEKKSMKVDSFAKWKIVDVKRFYKATSGEEERAKRLLAQRINEGLRNEFASRTLQDVVSGERNDLMVSLRESLNEITVVSMGVSLIDVRVKKIDFPREVSQQVYQRMKAERLREAKEHRAEGKEQAEIIRAEADRKSVVIEADAYNESEKNRGVGDAKASAVYASAYGRDPEFYAFTRSLTAYKDTFSGKSDILLLDPKSDFFKYFKNASGK